MFRSSYGRHVLATVGGEMRSGQQLYLVTHDRVIRKDCPCGLQIFYIENGREISKKNVLEKWQKTIFLKQVKRADAKGWILDIMNCIDSLNTTEFSLQDIYNFESDLKIIHPDNKHIKDKIRQQLQFLRDKNYLNFISPGRYRLK